MNGEPVRDSRDLRLDIARLAPGTNVTLTVVRDGKHRNVTITLGDMATDTRSPLSEEAEPAQDSEVLQGVQLVTLTAATADRLGLAPRTRGVVVLSVTPGTPAAASGLRPRDLIQEVNRQPVADIGELRRLINRAETKALVLLVNRGGRTIFLTIPGNP
jgi:serine protease Do